MPASILNITIEQGAEFRLPLLYKGSDGEPIDLTGYTARAQVRKKPDSETAWITFDSENDSIDLGGTAGTIELHAGAAATALVAADGVWDLFLQPPSAEPVKLLKGTVRVSKRVTKP